MGPVSIVSGFHCSMTMPNLYRLECLHTWFDDFSKILDPMFKYEGDCILPSDKPGLGIALNHEVLEQYIVDPESFLRFGYNAPMSIQGPPPGPPKAIRPSEPGTLR